VKGVLLLPPVLGPSEKGLSLKKRKRGRGQGARSEERGSRFEEKGSWLMARGSWFLATSNELSAKGEGREVGGVRCEKRKVRRRRRTTTSTMVYAQIWTEPKASGLKMIRKMRPYSMMVSGFIFIFQC
jgi:hypothetical protein